MQSSISVLDLLIQIPLVGVFVWFTLKIIKDFMAYISSRDTLWQAFFQEQRTAYHKSLQDQAERFGEEISCLAKEIAELRGQIGECLDFKTTKN